MLSSQEAQQRARDVELALGQMPPRDALHVLAAVIERAARRAEIGGELPPSIAPPSVLALTSRRRGSVSKIEADWEVRKFIHDHAERMTYQELEVACRKEFGGKRAPGKSSICRYVQKLRKQQERNDD